MICDMWLTILLTVSLCWYLKSPCFLDPVWTICCKLPYGFCVLLYVCIVIFICCIFILVCYCPCCGYWCLYRSTGWACKPDPAPGYLVAGVWSLAPGRLAQTVVYVGPHPLPPPSWCLTSSCSALLGGAALASWVDARGLYETFIALGTFLHMHDVNMHKEQWHHPTAPDSEVAGSRWCSTMGVYMGPCAEALWWWNLLVDGQTTLEDWRDRWD